MADGQEPGAFGPALDGWLRAALGGQAIDTTENLGGGYRNRNTLLHAGRGESFVLRQYGRPASGQPGGDADDAGEARRTCAVESALAARLRGVAPVPEVIAADPDGAVAGEPVMLSRFVPGAPLGEVLAGAGGTGGATGTTGARGAARAAAGGDAAALGAAAGAALAAIGTVGFSQPGFFDDAGLHPQSEGMPAGLADFVDQCLAAGPAPEVMSAAELAGLRALARDDAPLAGLSDGESRLVHSDYNPKNLLVGRKQRDGGGWSVRAVLDWEFAFSGSPLHDVGNMLRFQWELPPGYAAAFADGFRRGGGHLPPDWRRISQALDLYALADLLTRPVTHRYFGRALTAVRARLAG